MRCDENKNKRDNMATLKINYSKKEWLGMSLPFYHPSFEIKYDGKIIKWISFN